MSATQACLVPVPLHDHTTDFLHGGTEHNLTFDGADELVAIAERMDWVEELTPVTVADLRFTNEKGLVFRSNRTPIATVTKKFKVVQNRILLKQVARVLQDRGLDAWGTVCQRDYGHLVLRVFFRNPEYRVELALNAVDETTYVNLGLAVENGYGRPNTALRFDSIAYAPNDEQTHYFGRLIGRDEKRHTGNISARARKAISRLTAEAPRAARLLHDASKHSFDESEDAVHCLASLNYSESFGWTLLAGGPELTTHWSDPVTAWGLYKALLAHHARGQSSAPREAEILRNAEKLLETWNLDDLAKKGREKLAAKRLKQEEAAQRPEEPLLLDDSEEE